MYIINIVNIEGEPIVTRSYTEEAFLNMCNNKLHTNYTIEETNKAMGAFLDKYNYLEIHINPLITEVEPVDKYKQALNEIEINISEYQALTLGKSRTMRENDCIYNILDIINKVKGR